MDINNFADSIESSVESGNLTATLNRTVENISDGRDTPARNKMVEEVTAELYRRGSFPKLMQQYMTDKFSNLDLNSDGYIDKNELDKFITPGALMDTLNPLERQILRYAKTNYYALKKANGDQWLPESKVSRKDLVAFRDQRTTEDQRARMATTMVSSFYEQGAFNSVDTNRDGKVTEAEINSALKSNRFSQDQRNALSFMRENRKAVASASNDEWGYENKITRKDIAAYKQQHVLPAIPAALSTCRDFTDRPQPKADQANVPIADRILEFGKRNFKALDLDSNGYVTREEVGRIRTNPHLGGALTQADLETMGQLDKSLEQIQRSHRDEWWYKDRKGVTVADLENYARHQTQNNRAEIPTTPGDHHNLSIVVGGVQRKYSVHIPPGYDASKPMPVMYFYHYFTGNPEELAKYTGMNEVADKEKFIVVYPVAEGWVGNHIRQWNMNNRPSDRVDEVAFARELMGTVNRNLNVDRKRVYIAGYSNGGMIAQELASKMPQEYAGMASISGCLTADNPPPSEPVPTLLINGTRDKLVPFEGRQFTPLFPKMRSVARARDYWCNADRTHAYQVDRSQQDIIRETFRGDTPRQEVSMITMVGKGHGFPGQSHSIDGNPCTTLNGSKEVWAFLSKHQRPN